MTDVLSLGMQQQSAVIAKISPLRSFGFTSDDPQTIHPAMSDREKAGRENCLNDCLDDLAKRWREAFQRKGARLETEFGPSIPSFRFDYQRVHQIVGNLLDHALRQAPANSTVTLRCLSRPDCAEVSVTGATEHDQIEAVCIGTFKDHPREQVECSVCHKTAKHGDVKVRRVTDLDRAWWGTNQGVFTCPDCIKKVWAAPKTGSVYALKWRLRGRLCGGTSVKDRRVCEYCCEERKHATLFSATILAARKLAEIGDKPCPACECAISDAISSAELILKRIDERWPADVR